MKCLAFVIFLIGACVSTFVSTLSHADALEGSGSTFAYPFLQRMSRNYLVKLNDGSDFVSTENTISYEPIGSLGGVLRLQQPDIDFAASEFPISADELKKLGYIQFPIVIGGIAPVINIKSLASQRINLPGTVAADIYLGKIQNWSDPAIAAANRGVTFPDLQITVVHRADGSGSTFTWTDYLSSASSEWKSKYGANTLVSWPLGTSVRGSSKVIETVAETDGAIGYVEVGQAQRAGLSMALPGNANGEFVEPGSESYSAAALGAGWTPTNDFGGSLTSSTDSAAYPVTAATYIIMRDKASIGGSSSQALRFFRFILEEGRNDATELGYLPVPQAVVGEIKSYWASRLGIKSF